VTTLSRTFRLHRTRARRHGNRSFWRDAGTGLAVALVVLIMAIVATRATPGGPASGAWTEMERPMPLGGWETGVPPDLFPPRVYIGDEIQ